MNPANEPDRVELAQLPTPLVPLKRLADDLGGAKLWMKRDDLTGLELSGNKVRKLEYVAADALARGYDTLVTEGTCQSNHCRATAAVCAKLGMHAVLLLRPEPPSETQGNHLLDVLFGAELRCYPRPQFEAERESIIAKVLAALKRDGRAPRWTPMGASEPLGCWGYIRAMAELAEQLPAAGISRCDVILPVSSCGTFAGAVLGKLVHKLDNVRLLGVPVSDDVAYHTKEVGRLCREAIAQFELDISFDEGDLAFIDGYVGEGYAIPYPRAIEALRYLARTEGILLDPVYTAKAFCAYLEAAKTGGLGGEKPAIFMHTGGAFSNFAAPEVLLESAAPTA